MSLAEDDAGTGVREETKKKGPLVYRQSIFTRLTHWVWVVCLFFLLLSGLQNMSIDIANGHYVGISLCRMSYHGTLIA